MAKVQYVTPIGTARFVHLAKPDTKFDADGVYNCQLILDEEGFADFKAALDKFVDAQTWKNKKKINLPFEELEEDGQYAIRSKSLYRVPLFDSKNRKIFDTRKDDPENYPRIGSGSKLRLAVTFNAYSNKGEGVSLFLNMVQVIDLVEYGGASPFGVEDDGYEGEESTGGFPTEGEAESTDEALDI